MINKNKERRLKVCPNFWQVLYSIYVYICGLHSSSSPKSISPPYLYVENSCLFLSCCLKSLKNFIFIFEPRPSISEYGHIVVLWEFRLGLNVRLTFDKWRGKGQKRKKKTHVFHLTTSCSSLFFSPEPSHRMSHLEHSCTCVPFGFSHCNGNMITALVLLLFQA